MKKLTQEEVEAIQYACLGDAAKIISYLEEEKQRTRNRDLFLRIVTVVGAVGSVAAAVASVILLFQ